jgi:hypothetical protein
MKSGGGAPTATWDAAGFLVPALLIPTFFVDGFFHEGGHAVACVLQGNRITAWRLELPAETCCTSYNTISYAAGTVTSLAAWTVCPVIFARWLLPRLRQARWLQFRCRVVGRLVVLVSGGTGVVGAASASAAGQGDSPAAFRCRFVRQACRR